MGSRARGADAAPPHGAPGICRPLAYEPEVVVSARDQASARSRRPAGAARLPGHTKAPEGTDGDLRSAGPEATNKSAVPGRRLVPRSPALRPANLVPGTVPRIAPR